MVPQVPSAPLPREHSAWACPAFPLHPSMQVRQSGTPLTPPFLVPPSLIHHPLLATCCWQVSLLPPLPVTRTDVQRVLTCPLHLLLPLRMVLRSTAIKSNHAAPCAMMITHIVLSPCSLCGLSSCCTAHPTGLLHSISLPLAQDSSLFPESHFFLPVTPTQVPLHILQPLLQMSFFQGHLLSKARPLLDFPITPALLHCTHPSL